MERPDRLGMRGGFGGALGGRAIGKQDQRANDLIAPLELIPQPQRQLGKLWLSPWPLLLSVGWEKGVYHTVRSLSLQGSTRARSASRKTQSAALRIYVKETVTLLVKSLSQ